MTKNQNYILFKFFYFFLFFSTFHINTYCQQKSINATRTNEKIKIDGILNESSWKNSHIANPFVEFYPKFGTPSSQNSQIRILYNNHSIYFAAQFFDTKPDSIYSELTIRDDDNGNTDYFRISLNPNNDGQNTYEFFVSAANVQTDIRISEIDDDFSWDAVWYSEVQINNDGWTVEVEIPYSAIRFPKEETQNWAVNFYRIIRRNREISSWNPIDLTKGSESSQMGIIKNINNIDAPLRLSLMPYISSYVNSYEKNWGFMFNGGLDLKLGLSETYTLDMTLIPDFGQTKSDDQVLNLTPHETYYSENRQFFTEGTELFNKCGLFYSRRIGKTPTGYNHVTTNSEIDNYTINRNPGSSKLLNAFKISGRGKNNLAVGLFNAITGNTWAKVTLADGTSNRILTEPASNYNIFVLDQSLGQNSYINLTNANYYKSNENYLSNVTATSLKIMDKNNRFGINTLASYSMQQSNSHYLADGWKINSSIGKLTGTWVYSIGTNLITDKYESNDLGYQTNYNEISTYARASYRKFSQFWFFNESQNTIELVYNTLFKNAVFTGANINLSNFATTKKHLTIWNNLTIPLTNHNDYYEPRADDRFYVRPALYSENIFISTDYRKLLAFDFRAAIYFDIIERHGIWLSLSPITRIGKKFKLQYGIGADYDMGASGYAGTLEDDIIFGNRDVISFTNTINADYIFSNKLSLSLKARHYVSTVDYKSFYILENDGSLFLSNLDSFTSDYNFNILNVDLLLSWNFHPGSFLSIMWKNQIFALGDIPETIKMPGYFDSFKQIWTESQANNISLKLIYFLDYNDIIKKRDK